MRKANSRQSGLAFSAILLVVGLLAAIALSIALSQRSTSSSVSQEHAHLAATTVLNTAENIKRGVDLAIANGVNGTALTFDAAAGTGIFNPTVGSAVQQLLVPDATIDITRLYWIWHGASAPVKLMNVGSGAGSYVLEYDPITQETCAQINSMLHNDSTIPTLQSGATGAWWSNPGPNRYGATASTAVDASTDPAVNGRPEGCVYESGAGKYLYYKTVLDN